MEVNNKWFYHRNKLVTLNIELKNKSIDFAIGLIDELIDSLIYDFNDWILYMQSMSDYSIEELESFEEHYQNLLTFEQNLDNFVAKRVKTMQDLLELYKKDTFSDEDNRLINLAIDNYELYTDDIKEDFMGYMYSNIPLEYTQEEIWGYTDENYSNGLTHKENFNNLLNYLNK
jgi:hypothetical protein